MKKTFSGERAQGDGKRKRRALTVRGLQASALLRSNESFFPIEEWSAMEWGCAMAGEAGEVCNAVKKQQRGKLMLDPNPAKRAAAKEIADVVVYACLLASRLDVDLEDAVREKFNEVSELVKSEVRL